MVSEPCLSIPEHKIVLYRDPETIYLFGLEFGAGLVFARHADARLSVPARAHATGHLARASRGAIMFDMASFEHFLGAIVHLGKRPHT